MKTNNNNNQNQTQTPSKKPLTPILLRLFTFSLLLTLPLLLLFSLQPTPKPRRPAPNPGIRIRPGYPTYESYINKQLNKTLNPKLRHLWTTRDWDRKINVFQTFFESLQENSLLSNSSRALCIGARVGQEVEALRRTGVSESIGIDLVPCPPLVIHGDFHRQPFKDGTFDFEFSNVFDHALYPDKFVGEIERTLKPGGVCVLHVAITTRSDKYSANDLLGVEPLVKLFQRSEMVRVRKVDGFGLDTEAKIKVVEEIGCFFWEKY